VRPGGGARVLACARSAAHGAAQASVRRARVGARVPRRTQHSSAPKPRRTVAPHVCSAARGAPVRAALPGAAPPGAHGRRGALAWARDVHCYEALDTGCAVCSSGAAVLRGPPVGALSHLRERFAPRVHLAPTRPARRSVGIQHACPASHLASACPFAPPRRRRSAVAAAATVAVL